MKKILRWFLHPPVTGPSTILIIRLLAASVFFCEGFARLSAHEAMAHFIAGGEIIGSLLLLCGLFTRITAACFIIRLILIIPLQLMPATQILSCLFLLLEGPGRRSLDFRISTLDTLYRLS